MSSQAEIEAALIDLIAERDERIHAYEHGHAPPPQHPRTFAKRLIERVDELRGKEVGEAAVCEARERGMRDERVLNAIAAKPGRDVISLARVCGFSDATVEESLERIAALGFLRRSDDGRPGTLKTYSVSERYEQMA